MPLPFPYQHHSNPSGPPRPRSVSICSPPEQGARASSHRLLRRWQGSSFRVPTHPHPEEFSRKLPNSFFDPRFFQQLWQAPLAEPWGQWRLNQHHSNPSDLPRPQRVSTCSPLNVVPKGYPLACPAAGKPVLSVFPSALFTNSFWQASPPGGTRGLKATENQHHSNAGGLPRPQRVSTCSPLNVVPKGYPLACPATGKPVLSVFPSALFTNSFWQASPPGRTRVLMAAEKSRPALPDGCLVSNCHSE